MPLNLTHCTLMGVDESTPLADVSLVLSAWLAGAKRSM